MGNVAGARMLRLALTLLLLSVARGESAARRALAEPEPENEPEPESSPGSSPSANASAEEEPPPLPENPPLAALTGSPEWRGHRTAWLAAFALVSVLCVAQIAFYCLKLPSYRRFSLGTINLSLVILLSVSRCVHLIVDPYNVGDPSSPFFPLVVYGLGFPTTNGLVLTMTLAAKNLVWSVFHLERVNGGMLYRRRALFTGILLLQYIFQFGSDIVVGLSRQDGGRNLALASAIPSLVISCHLLFDAYGIALGVFLMIQRGTLLDHIQRVGNYENHQKILPGQFHPRMSANPLKVFILPLRLVAALHFVYVGCSFAFVIFYGSGRLDDVEVFLGVHNAKNFLEFSLIVVHMLFAFRVSMIKLRRRKHRSDHSSSTAPFSRVDVETSDAGGDRNEQQRPQVPSAETSSNNVQQVSRGGGEGGGDGVVSSNSYISSNKYIFSGAAEGSPYSTVPLVGDQDPIADGIIIGYDWCELYVNTCNRLPYLPYEDICEDIPDRGLVRTVVERHLQNRRPIGFELLSFTSPQVLLFSGEFALCVNGQEALRKIFKELPAGSHLRDYLQARVAEYVAGDRRQVSAVPLRKQSSILAMDALEGTELT